jgi:hypothetical protein
LRIPDNQSLCCLQEKEIDMLARCIQLDMECASICYTTARLMSLGSSKAEICCQINADICNEWAEECEKHAKQGMKHCRDCASASRKCASE